MSNVGNAGISDWLKGIKDEPIYWDKHRKDLIIKLGDMRSQRSKMSAFVRDLFGVRNYEKMYNGVKIAENNYQSDFKKTEKILKEMETDFDNVSKELNSTVRAGGCSCNELKTIRYNLWKLRAYPAYLSNYKDCKSWLKKDGNAYNIISIDIDRVPSKVEPEIIFGYAPYLFLTTISKYMSVYLQKGKTDMRKEEIQLLLNKVNEDMSRIKDSDKRYGQECIAVQKYLNNNGEYKSVIENYGKLNY